MPFFAIPHACPYFLEQVVTIDRGLKEYCEKIDEASAPPSLLITGYPEACSIQEEGAGKRSLNIEISRSRVRSGLVDYWYR